MFLRLWGIPLLLWVNTLGAQTCIIVSPPASKADGTASFELSLYSSSAERPVAIQWSFQTVSSSISSVTVDDGPVLVSAGKTAICTGTSGAYQCIAVGANAKTIASGLIAKVVAVLAPGSTTAELQVSNPLAVSADGYLIPTISRIKSIAVADLSHDCRIRPPSRGTSRVN